MNESALPEQDTVTLIDNASGKHYTLPVLGGTTGPRAIDVRTIYQTTGYFTYDASYSSTASCRSQITYVDGERGTLLHRGYSIEDLAEHSDFIEVAYLLLEGDLPNTQQKDEFRYVISRHTMVHEKLKEFYSAFRPDAHPMAIMCGVTGALSSFYHDSLDISDPKQRKVSSHRLIAKMPTMAALAYKYSIGQPFIFPRNDLNYAENFLHMMFAVPPEPYAIDPVVAKALDLILILHLDHEQNASTSTVRIAGSSGANPFACIAAGIASLWGPAHGGANEEVIKMLSHIGDKERIPEFIKRAKDKNDPFRLMGFGHRVYKSYDPRARLMRKTCHHLLEHLGLTDEKLLDLALELERIALEDEYFVQRKLYPNVDFYSGLILRAIKIPITMFTVLFAVARTVGWISQWKEMIEDPEMRISRPRQLYTGQTQRPYLPLDQRP